MAYLRHVANRYFACHDIPRDCIAKLGRGRRFFQKLETSDKGEARIRLAHLEAQWLDMIRQARGQAEGTSAWAARLFGTQYRAAPPAERVEIFEFAQSELGPVDRAEFDDLTLAPLRLTTHIDAYVRSLSLEQKTIDERVARIRKFAAACPLIPDITRDAVKAWATAQLQDMAAASVVRGMTDLRGYWIWLHDEKIATANRDAFDKIKLPKAPAKPDDAEDDDDGRVPFSTADILRLLDAAKNDAPLHAAITLAMWTGCRLGELTALKAEHVDMAGGSFRVVKAKSKAGRRIVPIHSKLRPILARMLKASTDSYVIAGLKAQKYGKRSNPLSKRFGTLKTAMGFGEEYVFHSIRKTVATLLENANVREGVAADILGHKKKTMTYGLYSGGSSLALKQEAIEKLAYGKLSTK